MKFKNNFLLSFLIFIASTPLFSQKTVTDTIPYKIGNYEVKKQQKVIELAEKLKVDPEIILKLNRLRSVERVLVTGLVVKIPVYAKGYKYEPVTVVINEVKPVVPDSSAKNEVKTKTKPAEPNTPVKTETKNKTKPVEPNAPANNEVKKPAKTIEPNLDSIAKAAAIQLQKERKDNLEIAREKARQDSIRAAHERVAKLRAGEELQKNYNPEIDQNNLMLVDATLELNEAMLAGVKASLDTLSKPDPELKNKNDVKEILQRMKRARDRKELIPYLEYMNDSLSLDCKKLITQKEDILSRLTPYLEHQRLQDSLATAKPTPEVASKAPADTKTKKPAKKTEPKPSTVTTVVTKDTVAVKKTEVTAKNNQKPKEVKVAPKYDTVIVYDLGKKQESKPVKEKTQKQGTTVAEKETVHKTVSDTISQKQKEVAQEKKPVTNSKKGDTISVAEVRKGKGNHWDTARAIVDSLALEKEKSKEKQEQQKTVAKTTVDTIASAKKQPEQKKIIERVQKTDTVVVIKQEEKKTNAKTESKQLPTKRDSTVVKIERDVTQAKAKNDTAKRTEIKPAVQKKDSVVVIEVKPATPKPSDKKSATADNTANVDTVLIIKSQFFLKRAQKALAEKKTKLAEEYLAKSLELWNNNYDAWMTLAEYDAQYGAPAKALKEYQECARIDSTKPKLFYSIASLHLLSKKKTEAVQYFTKSISLDTNYILAYMGRASIYSDWKQYDAALSDYNKVLQINKSYHFAYKARGMVKQLNRRFSEAVDDFTRYLIFEETDPSAYYYRGLAKIGNNELLEGCLDLSKSVELGYEAAEKAIKKSCE